jgi:hypothetical protein
MSTKSKPVVAKPFTLFDFSQMLSRALAQNSKVSELQIMDLTLHLIVTNPPSPVIEGMAESPASKAHALESLVNELAPIMHNFYASIDAAQEAGDLWRREHTKIVGLTNTDELDKLKPTQH